MSGSPSREPGRAEPATPSAAAAVTLRGVAKAFPNGTVALNRFDLDVGQGSFVSLIGPSGCGKSTALRLIAGLAEPSAGTVERTGPPTDIGFVFQDPVLMPWATVFDNVWLPLRLRRTSRRAAGPAVAAALDMVGLADVGRHYPGELSGGMKMRVSIARAVVARPRLLLMDEPFAALDEITRFRLNDDLLALRARLGTTIVFVTHSVYESVYLSDRIVVMPARSGRGATEIVVPPPAARVAAWRSETSYVATCRLVSDALGAAAAA